jgi:predicted AAA+ superfamily ATPase
LKEPGTGTIAEVDIFLSNGDYAVAVEVKSKPNIEDIKDHVERMKKLRGYGDRHNDRRKYIGAIAGMVVTDQVKAYAFK